MLRHLLLKLAARRYAARLPVQLSRDYGSKKTYSLRQIDRAIQKAGLNPRYAFLAHARYLSRSDFDALHSAQPPLSYYAARRTVIALEPEVALSGSSTPPPEQNGISGNDSWF